MIASGRRHWCRGYSWGTARRPAAVCVLSGAALALITVAIGLLNAVSVARVIDLALASAAITIAGLINYLISDSRTAWRRGFKLGFRIGVITQRDGSESDDTAMSTVRSQLSVHNVAPMARRSSGG